MSPNEIPDPFKPKKDVRLYFKYIKGTENEEYKNLNALKQTLINLGYIEDAGVGKFIQLRTLPKDTEQIVQEVIERSNMLTRSEK